MTNLNFKSIILTLVTLLTLGIGQMWATTYAIAGAFNDWSTTANQRTGTGAISITFSSTGSYTFKIVVDGSTWCGNSGTMTRDNCSGWSFTWNGGNNCTISVDKTGTYTFNIDNSTPTLTVTYPTADYAVAGEFNSWSTTGNTFSSNKTSIDLENGTTYKFKIVRQQTEKWYGNTGTMTSANCTNWDFAADDDAKITANITGTYVFELVNKTPRITVHYPVAISYNKGTSGTGTISGGTKTWGTNYTLSSSTFIRSGYTQDGWATSDGGDKAYNLGGTYSTHSAQTFYPHWVENMSSVSLVASPTGKGSFTIGGAAATSTSAGVTTTKAVTAVPIDGYHFVSWSITGGATISSTTTNPTTVTGGGAGAAATLTATFAADDVYTLTVAAGTGISAVTGTTNDIKAAQNIAITATVTPGYTWNTWTKTGSGTLSMFTAGTKDQTVTVGTAGDITLTASATENKVTLTPTVSYDHGSSNYTASSANNVGVNTTTDLTCSAPNAAHYTFAGWTLTNLTVTSGNAATDRSITVKITTAGSPIAAVANYNEVLTSTYVLKGSFDTWGSGVAMSKKSGHSTENWVYCTKEFTTSEVTLLKIYDGSSTWFGATASDNSLVKKTGSLKIDDWDLTSTSGGENINFGHYISGTYEFAYNTSTKKFYVTWPDVNQLQIYSADPTDATNTAYFDLSAPSSNVRSVSRTLNANTTYKFKIVYNSDYYGNGQTYTRGGSTSADATAQNTVLTADGDDMYLTTDYAGTYTFKFNESTKKLAIDFPEAYRAYLDVGTVKGNKNNLKIYRGSIANENIISSGTWVLKNTEVYFWAANRKEESSICKPGYNWWGFYDNAAGNTPTQYADARVGNYHTPITSDMHVYAVFGESNITITLNNVGNGNVYEGGESVTATTAHVETESNELTATPLPGWKFYNWTIPANVTPKSGWTASSNPLIINATAAATLTANYQPRWAVGGSNLPAGSAWSGDQYQINDNYYENPASSGKYEGQKTIDLAANTQYELKIKDRKDGDWYGFASGTSSAGVNIEYGESGTYNSLTKASGNMNIYLNSAAEGTYTFKWNEDNKQLAVVYPASCQIYHGVNIVAGGSIAAVDNESTPNTLATGSYMKKTATATFTATANTGYNFGGWYDEETCSDGHAYSAVDDSYKTIAISSNVLTFTNKTYDEFSTYAKFTPKTYTITLTRSGEGYSTGGDATATATFNATLPAVTLPTAANGYAFMGYYSGEDGTGTQFMNASGTWATSVPGTIVDSKWKLDAGATLYAYFKKAEITGITLSPGATVAPSTDVTPTTVTATPTVSPTPVGATKICWKLLRDNGNPITPQPTFSTGEGNAVTFPAPKVSGSYKVACVLRTGSECGAGTVLDSVVADLVVAGEHTVTIQYQDGDGRTLKDTIHITGKPLEWTTLGDITPPTITGYTFARWDAGDGITIKNGDSDPVTTTTTSSIQIKAIYDGTLTAVYTKKRMIYFYNNLGWESVYVYFYKNDSYWQIVSPYNGSGANTTYTWTNTPYSEGLHGQMQPVSVGSNIYYFDVEAAGVNASYDDVVFTEDDQHGERYFRGTKAVRRGDYKSSMPMFVPLTDQTPEMHNGTEYTSNGYWMNYPENSGYTLKIYDNVDADKASGAIKSYAFPYSGDLIMPLKIDVEFTDGYNHDYWFMVYRNDGTYMGNTYHFKQGWNDKQIISEGNNKSKITTSAPGKYKFTLTYHDNGSGTVNYYIDVDFPIADGDYRIVYTDNATWSQDAHGASWNHPSDVISKAVDAKKDTVSFFVSKGDGITPAMKFQKASVTNEGVVTWSDVAGGSITIPSSITTSGVYNFIVSQPEGGASISLEKVEPYTGNFYIRTDCAGNTKWDSFKNIDHLMTYSEFAKDNSGFTHYYAHWVTTGQSVKFTIANDYSMCISDTLIQDYGTAIADIDGVGILESDNASIRFMWDQATNKISRAYIRGSSTISDRFLVLEGDSRLFDENGDAYRISGLNPNEVNLIDDQNFVYERIIKVQPGAQAKLTAEYNGKVQYFQGGSGSTSADSIILLGGKASVEKYDMRIVYDFKTNRLIRAYQPSGTIDDSLAINADMMIVREHQDAGNQLVLTKDGTLSEVKTVYGVMRFNRWTLNNKDKSSHSALPVSEQKSSIWRGLYWISFPFDVNLSDVFGFGTYGTDWIIMYYDGARRAKEGYWADSKSFWTYIWNRRGVTLKAGEGYVLALELPNMKDDNTSFWTNNIEQVELFFPSASTVNKIKQTNVDITVASHECTIDRRTDKSSGDANKDRRIADSHWNVIGVPSYANYGTTLKDGSGATITWNSNPATQGLPFLYEWNANDNTYTPQSGTTYNFKSMHSYIVQYTGTLRWLLASATPSIVARRTYSEAPQSVEFRLELQKDDEFIDQTFVKMSNDEEVSAAFAFGEDMTKEFNGSKSNIYTLIENYLPTAGNTLPISESITIVPVGIKIKADGDYTFAIPDGTDGVGITLVDEETGIRTNLSLLNYNVYLEAGTYNNRFYLEISPVRKTPTSLEGTQSNDTNAKVRKVLINDILYIVKDGMIFDAHGARVQ